jgi:hypothetical protein
VLAQRISTMPSSDYALGSPEWGPFVFPSGMIVAPSEGIGLGSPGFLEDLSSLGDSAMKIGKAAKWMGIGVLALAGGVLLFRVVEVVLGE